MITSNDPTFGAEPPLRRAGPADATAIRSLTRAAYGKWVPVLGREPKPMGADYERAVREHRIDLVEIRGELAALIELIAEPDALLVENVAVSPAHQGRGFGQRLLRHAESVAAEAGVSRVRLYTNRLMTANVTLYASLGYATDREEENAFGTVVHMSRSVRPRL